MFDLRRIQNLRLATPSPLATARAVSRTGRCDGQALLIDGNQVTLL
jgi:hypothetical protein